jgi:hypothetical protein
MQKKIDGFIIDTCKNVQMKKYVPGAIVYAGRKQMETKQWKEQMFDSQEEADDFVRTQLAASDMKEMGHVGELPNSQY